MASAEELRWMKSTANELNNLLQLISESGQALERFLPRHEEAEKYLGILRTSTERAVKVGRNFSARAEGGPQADVVPFPTIVAGATVTVPPPVPTEATPTVEIHNPGGTRELVLIVDDEEFITLLAQQVLTDEGYRVVTAKNGFQAIELYRKLKDQVSLVILDFVMPVMDGADVFAELQQIDPAVPVVLSSGFAEQDRLRGMLARGLRGFIPKPYTQQKLLDQIRQTLDAIQAEQ
jgi:CheY-like chemotaxis protein